MEINKKFKVKFGMQIRESVLGKLHHFLHRRPEPTIKSLGRFTYGTDNINLRYENQADLIIGSFCSIASDVTVFLGGGHRTDLISTYPFGLTDTFTGWQSVGFVSPGNPNTNGDVQIGNDVWIGSGVTIMSGVIIGDGSVIAANAHVVKNVEPYSLVGGNPAKLIKYRFTEEARMRLQEIKWWDWEESKIRKNQKLICSIPTPEILARLEAAE